LINIEVLKNKMKDCGVFEKAIFTINGAEAVKSAKERIE
jgi:hypothetical protein